MNKTELINAIIEDSKVVVLDFTETIDTILNDAGVKKYSGNVIPKRYGNRSVPTNIDIYVENEGTENETAWDDNNVDWDFKAAVYNKINQVISSGTIETASVDDIEYEYSHAKITVYKILDNLGVECKYLVYKKQDGSIGFKEMA